MSKRTLIATALIWFCTSAVAAPPDFITPDEADMIRAVHTLQDGFPKDAYDKFRRAAKLGNKEAQKNIGLMYIQGLGVEKNWPMAYCWLKLASTSGDNKYMAARDEVYNSLRPDEKEQAIQDCQLIEDEFGDLEALKRRERWIRRQKREVTGSRLGNVGALRIQISDATGYQWELSGTEYFQILDTYVSTFKAHVGNVEFGDLEIVEDNQTR